VTMDAPITDASGNDVGAFSVNTVAVSEGAVYSESTGAEQANQAITVTNNT